MRKFLLLIGMLLWAFGLFAQEEGHPVRTPEEEALKQTEMLQVELQLTEAQYDTIYRIHLKYARLRQLSNTRAEAIERLNLMTQEITAVLTKKQQDLFLNKQLTPVARPFRPQRLPQPADTPVH